MISLPSYKFVIFYSLLLEINTMMAGLNVVSETNIILDLPSSELLAKRIKSSKQKLSGMKGLCIPAAASNIC